MSEEMAKLNVIWKDKNVTLKYKIRILCEVVFFIFLYVYETQTVTADLERRTQVLQKSATRSYWACPT